MKFIKQIIVRIIHSFGFDITRITDNQPSSFLGIHGEEIRTVIDIGANRGQFAKKALHIFPKAHIYCFEPLGKPFSELQRWAKTVPGRVTPVNTALGETKGKYEIFLHEDHDDSSSFLKSTSLNQTLYPSIKKQHGVQITQTTLDDAVQPMGPLEKNLLIKMDVQGYEDRVIRGGTKTFKNAYGCIVEVCLDTLYQNQATFKDIFLLMDSLGLEYRGNIEQVAGDDGHVIYIDALFINPKNA